MNAQPADLKIFLLGSTGRMGSAILEVLADPVYGKGFHLEGACSGRDIHQLKAIESLPRGTIVINFSSPAVSIEASGRTARIQGRLLECSTGFSESEIAQVADKLRGHAWAMTPNTSLGVYAFTEAARVLATILPDEYKMNIWESHHVKKLDAPSGTAKLLKKEIEDASHPARVSNVESIREGNEVGHHRLNILGPYENLGLEHHAQDRKLFALGALKLAQKLSKAAVRDRPFTAAELWSS